MEYITTVEASEKWGISLRQAQRLLAANRINDAKKYGRSWMIPEDAGKPRDPRSEEKPPKGFPCHEAPSLPTEAEFTINPEAPSLPAEPEFTLPPRGPSLPAEPEFTLQSDMDKVLELAEIPLPKNNIDAVLDLISEESFRFLVESYITYMRGDFKRTIQCFRKIGDTAFRLRACSIAIAVAVSTGNYPLFQEIESYCKGMILAERGANVTVMAEYTLSTAYASAFVPTMVPNWIKDGDLSAFPHQIRAEAICRRARYLHFLKKYESVLDVAQTALAICKPEDGLTYESIYLRLMCAAACYSLDRMNKAKGYLLDVMRDCMPNGFITPFAELRFLLSGLLDQLLKQNYPEHYGAIVELSKRILPNWLYFHNRFTKDNITLILSVREYQIATYAARGAPYAKIAEQFSISVGRLRIIMHEIFSKLFIKNRKELAQYII